MEFEWDADKAKRNFTVHGIRFQEAIPVFDDDNAVTILDDLSDPTEERYVTLGMGAKGSIFVVVYVYRGENIRIISARKAEPHERKAYGE